MSSDLHVTDNVQISTPEEQLLIDVSESLIIYLRYKLS